MGDYIRTYFGMMGSGKTTRSLLDVEQVAPVVVYAPERSNSLLEKFPAIQDGPNYLAHLGTYLTRYRKLLVLRRNAPSHVFTLFSRMRGTVFVLDDVAALTDDPDDAREYKTFLRTVRMNGNRVVQSTHRLKDDLPPLIRTIGTSFYYVGPAHRDENELKGLYHLTNYPITWEDFYNGITTTKARETFCIRSASTVPSAKNDHDKDGEQTPF